MWSIEQVLRRAEREGRSSPSPSAPIALTSSQRGAKVIARLCRRCLAADVKIGMKLADAKALLPEAEIFEFSIEEDREALEKLSIWAQRFSPIAAKDSFYNSKTFTLDPRASGINLDISGSRRLFGGERRMLKIIDLRLKRAGLSARYALAPNLGAAWALSRYRKNSFSIAEENGLQNVLFPLPISALRIAKETVLSLKELNVFKIGELLSLDRNSLRDRFGKEIVVRLEQALGLREEKIQADSKEEIIRLEKNFLSPLIEIAAVEHNCLLLLQEMLTELSAAKKKPSAILLELKRVQAKNSTLEISLNFPTLNQKLIANILVNKLEKTDIGRGVEALSISAPETLDLRAKVAKEIYPLSQDVEDKNCEELLDSIIQKIGSARVLSLEKKESYVPEKSFCYKPLLETRKGPWQRTAVICQNRPSFLFERAEEIRALALMPDSPPSWIKWRKRDYRLLEALGPERISPEWWSEDKNAESTRDYFKAQLPNGVWLWLYRELESSRWFVQGLWA